MVCIRLAFLQSSVNSQESGLKGRGLHRTQTLSQLIDLLEGEIPLFPCPPGGPLVLILPLSPGLAPLVMSLLAIFAVPLALFALTCLVIIGLATFRKPDLLHVLSLCLPIVFGSALITGLISFAGFLGALLLF